MIEKHTGFENPDSEERNAVPERKILKDPMNLFDGMVKNVPTCILHIEYNEMLIYLN